MSAYADRKSSSEENKLSYNEKSDNGVDAFVVDAEAANAQAHGDATLHRTMKNRHVAMIRFVFSRSTF